MSRERANSVRLEIIKKYGQFVSSASTVQLAGEYAVKVLIARNINIILPDKINNIKIFIELTNTILPPKRKY